MKKNFVKRVLAMGLVLAMTIGSLTGCGKANNTTNDTNKTASNDVNDVDAETEKVGEETVVTPGVGGTILWLSNLSSGIQYETANAYLSALCEKSGYDFKIVYGDGFNDAAGNLQAVKNGMTSDVVGIIASQDGGLASIMEEYPDVYVAGYNTDMTSVYGEGGENAACLENDHFLGTICDQTASGEDTAKRYFDEVVAKGYKKVAVIIFPSYAYPIMGVAAETFGQLVDEYNATAAEEDKITIVGETTTLEFQPLADSWFLEEGRGDLDCIVSICAGIQFVFPTMASAIANGTCSEYTKMLSSGFDTDSAVVMAIGDDEVMSYLSISPAEDPLYAFVLIDNAVNGCQFADWTNARLDSAAYVIDSTEDIENVMAKSMAGTADVSKAQISIDDALNFCARNNPDATYAQLVDALLAISTDQLK